MKDIELLTIQETAQLLRVTPITVRRYIAAGRLPAVKVGKGVRVRKEAVENLLEPVEPDEKADKTPARRGRGITAEDPIWNIIGIGQSKGPTDVSTNKHTYLAEAYAPKR